MAIGTQSNPGQASRIFFSSVGQGYEPSRSVSEDSEGMALGRLQQQTQQRQLDLQAQQGAAQLTSGNANAAADRDVQLQLGLAPINLKRDIFGQISPLLTGLIGGAGGQNGRVGGDNTAQPSISRGPMFSDQQVNEQVNAAKSSNAANADTAMRGNATRLAGQGFGSNSPLLAALNSATGMQRAGADATADRETRYDAAQKNADQTFRTDQLAEGQWNDFNQADIARRQAANSYVTSLASILGGLV